ncbi:Uncharacterised protein [Mycobacteroides abscessus subsp. abscessus]|nr:Uncharacterised protein [Mycobacteroides abscessus subsp. abscessus]
MPRRRLRISSCSSTSRAKPRAANAYESASGCSGRSCVAGLRTTSLARRNAAG